MRHRFSSIFLSRKSRVTTCVMFLSAVIAAPVFAAKLVCPKTMPPAVEEKLRPILEATSVAIRNNDWFDKKYESILDALLDGKDDASIEARVALMDYPISIAYSEQLSCVVSVGGKKAWKYLELYSRCDIAPSNSPVPRDHGSNLRLITMQAWKAGHGKGSCDFE